MRRQGFTLIELVLVMVLLAITALGVSSYLGYSATAYADSVQAQRLLGQGRFALERLSRELRTAAPNSVRWAQNAQAECLEFAPIVRSGLYRQLPLYPATASYLDVVTVGDDWVAAANQRLVIYPTTAAHIYMLSQGRAVTLPAQTLDDADGNLNTRRVALPSGSSFVADSPQQRFYLLENPISFCRIGSEILRYSNYGFQNTQPLPPAVAGSRVLGNVQNTVSELAFAYSAGSLSRHAAVQLVFNLRTQDDTNALLLHHEVNIPNVP